MQACENYKNGLQTQFEKPHTPRHLQTRHLWLQSHLKLDVVAGDRNPAGTLTKPLPGIKGIQFVLQNLATQWIQIYPCKTKAPQETATN